MTYLIIDTADIERIEHTYKASYMNLKVFVITLLVFAQAGILFVCVCGRAMK